MTIQLIEIYIIGAVITAASLWAVVTKEMSSAIRRQLTPVRAFAITLLWPLLLLLAVLKRMREV